MIQLTSKTQHASLVFPGVVFTIRKYSAGLKHRIALDVASIARRFNEISQELEPLRLQYRRDCDAAPDNEQPNPPIDLLALIAQRDQIIQEFDQAWVRAGFVRIDGAEIDGAPITADSLIESAPPEMYEDFLAFTKREYGLTETEKANLEPPSTLGGVAGGDSQPTSAENAGSKASTLPETAAAISPATSATPGQTT